MVIHHYLHSCHGWYLSYSIRGSLLILRFKSPLCPHLVDSYGFLMCSCIKFLCTSGLKSDLTLGGLGDGLLALLIEVILTLIGLFRVILTVDLRDWYIS